MTAGVPSRGTAGVSSRGVAALADGGRLAGQKCSGSHDLSPSARENLSTAGRRGSQADPVSVLPRGSCVFAASGDLLCPLAATRHYLLAAIGGKAWRWAASLAPSAVAGLGRLISQPEEASGGLDRAPGFTTASFLPPVPRSPSGYRRYGDAHLHAVLAYRALSTALGPVQGKALLRAVDPLAPEKTAAAVDEAHALLHRERSGLRAAREAARLIAAEPVGGNSGADSMSVSELAEALGIRPSALRHWEAEGPGDHQHSLDEALDARQAAITKRSLAVLTVW